MKYPALLASFLIATLPAFALAQTATKPAAKSSKAAKPAAKTADKKLAPAAQKAVEEATPLEEPDPNIKLTEADIAVAKRVYVGEIPCELGASVKITALKREGFFLIQTGRNRFRMHPVESRTGAIRLEDPVRGAMWLQLGNKSMLMSQKLGQRLADECQAPDQVTFAEAMKNKPPVNLLEPAPKVSPAAIEGAAAMPQHTPLPATPAVPVTPATPATPAVGTAPASTTPATPTPAAPAAAPAATPASGAKAATS